MVECVLVRGAQVGRCNDLINGSLIMYLPYTFVVIVIIVNAAKDSNKTKRTAIQSGLLLWNFFYHNSG